MKTKSSFATICQEAISKLTRYQANSVSIFLLNEEIEDILSKKNISVKNLDGSESAIILELKSMAYRNFDYAILLHKIQLLKNPRKVLQEMLRVAEYGIISFENHNYFGNYIRKENQDHYYSIKDFERLCRKLGFSIEKKILASDNRVLSDIFDIKIIGNIFARHGFFLIKKKEISLATQEEFILNQMTPKLNIGYCPSSSAFNNSN